MENGEWRIIFPIQYLSRRPLTLNSQLICGSSSVDRALAFQAEGRGFESRLPLRIGE